MRPARRTLLRRALAAPRLGAGSLLAAATTSLERVDSVALTRFADAAAGLERLRATVVMRDREVVLGVVAPTLVPSTADPRVGELFRLGGLWEGQRVLASSWIEESYTPRTLSPWSGDRHG